MRDKKWEVKKGRELMAGEKAGGGLRTVSR